MFTLIEGFTFFANYIILLYNDQIDALRKATTGSNSILIACFTILFQTILI